MTYLNIKESPDPIPEPLPLVSGCPGPASVIELQGLLQAAQVAARPRLLLHQLQAAGVGGAQSVAEVVHFLVPVVDITGVWL